MSAASPDPVLSTARRAFGLPDTPGVPALGRAPLVPAALAVTVGILFDRYLSIPLAGSLTLAVVALAVAVQWR